MSTQVNLYVMLCAPIPKPKDEDYQRLDAAGMFDSAFDDKPKGLFVLYDSMCGKYCYAGRAILKTEDMVGHGFEFKGIPGYEVEIPEQLEKIQLQLDIKEKLGVVVELKDIKVRAIMHYR